MASFSIQELLGLGKVNSSNSSEDDLPAAKNSKPRAAGHGTAASEPEASDIDKDIDVETLEEEDNAAEPVIVEVHSRIVSPALSVTRGAGASRKRKRSKQAEDSPAKSDEECTRSSGCSSNHHSDSNSEERSSGSRSRRTPKSTTKRLRTAFTTAQLRTLEYSFRMCPYPDSYGREQIARLTGIDESKIQVWFQNRRARYRKREKPMEAQKSSGGAAQSSITASPFPHHSMMQAYFTAAALQQQGTNFKLPITPTAPLGPLSAQQFYTPTNPFIATVPAASYPHPLFTYPPATPMDLMAAAAQINATRQTQKNHSPPK